MIAKKQLPTKMQMVGKKMLEKKETPKEMAKEMKGAKTIAKIVIKAKPAKKKC